MLVLGLGKSGVAAARVLHDLGALVTVNDGGNSGIPDSLSALDVRVVTGKHDLALFDDGISLLVKNPGIRYDNVMVAEALRREIPVITEVELAWELSEAEIIGITGTAGKTTTTTLIADILSAGGRTPKLAGNIGFPASEVVSAAGATDDIVMELSSFQLQGTQHFHPHIAVIVNFYSAHLDWHGSQEAYENAKWRIQAAMNADDFLVLNFNQPKLEQRALTTKATIVPFATDSVVNGAYSKDGVIFYKGEEILRVSDLSLPGDAYLENALAALAVAKIKGIDNAAIISVLTTFKGVKHRNQYLGELSGRKVYNDSKATNIVETQHALSGFDAQSLWLIAGGLDRGNDFDALFDNLSGLKGLVVVGETADKLASAADRLGIPVVRADKVDDALTKAFAASDVGDVILLSPACASWDQYKTFEERGDLFIDAFEALRGAK